MALHNWLYNCAWLEAQRRSLRARGWRCGGKEQYDVPRFIVREICWDWTQIFTITNEICCGINYQWTGGWNKESVDYSLLIYKFYDENGQEAGTRRNNVWLDVIIGYDVYCAPYFLHEWVFFSVIQFFRFFQKSFLKFSLFQMWFFRLASCFRWGHLRMEQGGLWRGDIDPDNLIWYRVDRMSTGSRVNRYRVGWWTTMISLMPYEDARGRGASLYISLGTSFLGTL